MLAKLWFVFMGWVKSHIPRLSLLRRFIGKSHVLELRRYYMEPAARITKIPTILILILFPRQSRNCLLSRRYGGCRLRRRRANGRRLKWLKRFLRRSAARR